MVTGKQEKLVEWKVLVDTIGIKSADLKDINIFFFPNCLDVGKGPKLPYAV